jgi:ubiquitin carboxyl-terminal hydrolase 7
MTHRHRRCQTSAEAVSTLELTRSFGWNSLEAFTQHDVTELQSILLDGLEKQMVGTPLEGRLGELYEGTIEVSRRNAHPAQLTNTPPPN